MKTLRVCGWAVIFTVTLLLVACASQSPKVTYIDTTSGSDATVTQPDNQMFEYEDSAIVISQDWLDERERAVEEKELAVDLRGNALAINEAWIDERQRAVEEKELAVDLRGNALAINEAWIDEREMRLTQRKSDLERHENMLAINQAWLNEREMQLARRVPDLTRQEDMLAFRQVFGDEGDTFVGTMERSVGNYVKLAGADASLTAAAASPTVADAPRTRIEGGRCYATVVFPAEYKTVAVTKPIEVPKGENLPVLYQTVTEKVKVTDEQMRWEEVICEDRMTSCRVVEIQRALYRGGYDPGPIDGVAGKQTMAAVNEFQKDYNLTVADQLTIETVRALDANF